jgi:polysaccharide biosynthesis transport protein
MNLQQIINILWLRKSIALAALIITVLTATVVSLLLPKQYVATATIVIDQHSADPVTGQPLSVQLMPGYMATQVDVISSHNVARKVVEILKLNENPDMQSGFEKSGDTGNIQDWIADTLLESHLDVIPSRESSTIQISFTSGDPQFAANVANAFAEAYIYASVELRTQPAKLNADWFDRQMATLRDKLVQAQSVLSNYQQQHSIVVTDNHLDLEIARLDGFSKELTESQTRTRELESRIVLLKTSLQSGGGSGALKEVLDSSLIQNLKSQQATVEANFAEVSKQVDVNHPKYKQAKAEVDSLQKKIWSEINMVLSSVNNDMTASSRRSAQIANILAEQNNKILELKKQHDEIAVLKSEVENTQKAYDTVMQQAVKSRMESEISQTNISVLNSALTPQKHAKPQLRLNIMLSIFLGSLLAIGVALVAELMDRRVRSAFDVSEILAIPLSVVVPTQSLKLK